MESRIMTFDLAALRRRLQADLAQIDASISQANDAARTVMLDQSSVGRLSRMDAMQQQAMAQGMQERLATQKRKLEAALTRIDAGRFGLCCECDAEIGRERLEGDPAAVFCIDCVQEHEVDGHAREPR
jgi:DnaK suppressor protein